MVNTILKEADLFCPNSVRINFTIYHLISHYGTLVIATMLVYVFGFSDKLLGPKENLKATNSQ
ncbi:hypothetical protein FEZ42_15175 [Lactiplantibacillus plantarum]|nr:hypothetical protein FEZ42_15175 [Lactiplantibacillus plantarum]